jgi:hypothetical protein
MKTLAHDAMGALASTILPDAGGFCEIRAGRPAA